MGHAAQENLLDKTFPLSAHDDERDVLGFQHLQNCRERMARIKDRVHQRNIGAVKTRRPGT